MSSKDHSRGNAMRRSRPHHPRTPREVRYRVGRTHDLKSGESMKFMLPIRGVDEECFAINYHGHFHAYVNRCRHVPMAMDWVDNEFFAEQGRYVRCQTHTANSAPASGEWIAAPPTPCARLPNRDPPAI